MIRIALCALVLSTGFFVDVHAMQRRSRTCSRIPLDHDVDWINHKGRTALEAVRVEAYKNCRGGCVGYPDRYNYLPTLYCAVERGDHIGVKNGIECAIQDGSVKDFILAVDTYNNTALHRAVMQDDLYSVCLILKTAERHGFFWEAINVQNDRGHISEYFIRLDSIKGVFTRLRAANEHGPNELSGIK